MDYQKKIVEFLSKPENLPIALEVSHNMEALRRNFHKSFWEEFPIALQARITASAHKDRWVVIFEDVFDENYAGCMIQPKGIRENFKGSYLSICLEQDLQKDGYQLHYGLIWNKEHVAVPTLKSYKKLFEASVEAGVPELRGNKWWPALIDLDLYLESDDFILQYGLNRAEFITNLSERIWTYFESIESELAQFNKDMIRS